MLPLPGELPSTGNKSIMRPKVCISKSYRSSSEQLSFLSPSLSFFSSLSRPHYFISRDCVKWKRKSLAVQSPFFPVSIISSFHRASYLSLSLSPSITFLARETTPVVHINVYLINPHLAPSCPLPRRSHLRGYYRLPFELRSPFIALFRSGDSGQSEIYDIENYIYMWNKFVPLY